MSHRAASPASTRSTESAAEFARGDSGPGPGLVTHFFLSCPSRHEPPRKPPLDTHLTPSSSASRR
eukprot:scaffold17269_cov78-Phaeocystis_antarctica.AAC.2